MKTRRGNSLIVVVEDPDDGSGFDKFGQPVTERMPFDVWLHAREPCERAHGINLVAAWQLSPESAEQLGQALMRGAREARERKATT
jgi:hypothetical protein